MANEDKDNRNNRTPKNKPRRFRTLRILVIEPRGQYCRMVWCAIGIGISHILIGATVMSVLLYYLNKGDAHTILCTIAYHLFTSQALLSLNYANGWSAPLQLRHRRCAHIFLQICSITCAVSGAVLVYMSKDISGSVHSITGLAATILACVSFIIGPCALLRGRRCKLLHSSFGIPTFVISSISLCTGLFTSAFKEWTNSTVIFLLIGFVVFYTTFILVTSFIKCMMKI